MAKVDRHISLDPELNALIENMNINVSAEFEKWIKIRYSQPDIVEEKDYALEIAKHKEALANLEAERIEKERMSDKQKQEDDFINKMITNAIREHPEKSFDWISHSRERAPGIQAIWKRVFNKVLTFPQAVEMYQNKLREKGIDVKA